MKIDKHYKKIILDLKNNNHYSSAYDLLVDLMAYDLNYYVDLVKVIKKYFNYVYKMQSEKELKKLINEFLVELDRV